MIIRIIGLAAAISSLASAALADGDAVATLKSPVAKPVNVIAGDAYWTCQASSCTTGAASDQTLTVSACRDVVKAAGAVSAFAVGPGSLNDAQLAKCNTAAKH